MTGVDPAREREWHRVRALYREGDAIPARVLRHAIGGLIVDVGLVDELPAFLPSHRPAPDEAPDHFGRALDCRIVRFDDARRTLIVGRLTPAPGRSRDASPA